MENNWEDFWKEWRNKKIETEEDLYFQVGRTVDKKPAPREIFDHQNEEIAERLSLNENDIFVDLCCGNGLCTYEFRDTVKQIIAVDFAPQMIEAARQFKSAANITYCLEDVIEFLKDFRKNFGVIPNKFLMNGSLSYFTVADLETILNNINDISDGDFVAYFTSVPNDLRKWNFYNTEERRQKYLENVAKGNFLNDGLGRWWAPAEIKEVCSILDLKCDIRNQELPVSDYRMDVILRSKER